MSGKTRPDCSPSLAGCRLPRFQKTATRAAMQAGQGLAILRLSYGWLATGPIGIFADRRFTHLIDAPQQVICVGRRRG
ncbi:hypothetical protein CGRA01v4_11649 [Colletotrichum graminicola]|nr:hypothetical protein CGRA01v4_11649 [Colletotrichum graminicola]